MGYGFKIEMVGFGDITDKISSFQITDSIEQYAREMTLSISDAEFYDSLDFSIITPNPEITISTKIADTFVQQGQFFIERPSLVIEKDSSRIQSVWGRSNIAKLSQPFSGKVNKVWTTYTTFYTIAEEMCDLGGITWDGSLCEPNDYAIFAFSYSADYIYPIEVIAELASFVGGKVITDKDDNLRVVLYKYTPTGPKWEITDNEIISISESPQWPEFGNRIRITPLGNLSGYTIGLSVEDQCIPADGTSRSRLVAQVIDSDGAGVNEVIVAWSHDGESATLRDGATSTTRRLIISGYQTQALSFYTFELPFIPITIDHVFALSDRGKVTDLASEGYSIDGRIITLVDKLSYCNTTIEVEYKVDGGAVNYLVSGTIAEDVVVTTNTDGEEAKGTVFIDNPCMCPISISLEASPTTFIRNEVCQLLVYAEEQGPVTDGKRVYMSMGGQTAWQKGALSWDMANLGTVRVQYEQATINNDIEGLAQCNISKYIASVTAVYLDDGDGNITGSNLYSSHSGKLITLTSGTVGQAVLVDYTVQGAAINWFLSEFAVGQEEICAVIPTTREDPVRACVTITVANVNLDGTDSNTPSSAFWNVPGDTFPDGASGDFGAGSGSGGGTGPADGGYGGIDNAPGPDGSSTFTYYRPRIKGCGRTVNICPSGFVCCESGGAVGCFKRENCDDPLVVCTPESVEENSRTALRDRFIVPKETCPCPDICASELTYYGTTQDYDNHSMRTIDTILRADFGLTEEESGSAYWEQRALEEADAVGKCIYECDPVCTGTIVYTTLSMQFDDEQSLSVGGFNVYTEDDDFTWQISSGGGTLSETTGKSTLYTAPPVNAECEDNPTIQLFCSGVLISQITIAINVVTSSSEAYRIYTCQSPVVPEGTGMEAGYNKFRCDGVQIGGRFSCDGCDPCTCAEDMTLERWGDEEKCDLPGGAGTYDQRTPQMITDGCCPEALL